MELDRTLWSKASFDENDFNKMHCPFCHAQGYSLHSDTSKFALIEDERTRSIIEESPGYPEEWETNDGAVVLVCTNCSNNTVISGHFGSTPKPSIGRRKDQYGDHDEYWTAITIWATFPSLPLFQIPADTPQAMQTEIKKAFGQFFFDRGSCGNRIRASLEVLMDAWNIRKFELVGKTKKTRKRLTLDRRIKEFGQKTSKADVTTHLTAVKWIGNEGSHGGNMEVDDLLDGFELLLHVLDSLYHRPKVLKTLQKKSDAINKRKKPLSKK